MYRSNVPSDYRNRDKMNLIEFIADVEECHFRTVHDTGAHPNAMFLWNILREYAGLDSLDEHDLHMNHAKLTGKSLEEIIADYREYEEYRRNVKI